MGIAKRTLRVGKKELHELFGLPEDIEILAVRPARGWDDEVSFEFLIASAGEVEINGYKITVEQDVEDFGLIRRISLDTIKRIQNGEEINTGGVVSGDVWCGQPTIALLSNNEPVSEKESIEKITKEIFKGFKKKGLE